MATDSGWMMEARRRRENRGSLWAGDPDTGEGVRQEPGGARAVTRRIGGVVETFRRPSAPSVMGIETGPAGEFGQRELAPGEYEALRRSTAAFPRPTLAAAPPPPVERVPTGGGGVDFFEGAPPFGQGLNDMRVDRPRSSVMEEGAPAGGSATSTDRNGDGIPDGAVVRLSATWRQGRSSVMAAPGSLTGQAETRAAEGALAEQAMGQREKLRGMRESSPFSRNTVGGVTLPELARARDERAAERSSDTARLLGVADRQFVRPAQEATRRVEIAQEGANVRGRMAEESARTRLLEQGRQFNERLGEVVRRFNAKIGERIAFAVDPISGESLWTYNGQAGRVRQTPDGFIQLFDEKTGASTLTMTERGDVVTFDRNGRPVVARPGQESLPPVSAAQGSRGAAAGPPVAASMRPRPFIDAVLFGPVPDEVKRAPTSPGKVRARRSSEGVLWRSGVEPWRSDTFPRED